MCDDEYPPLADDITFERHVLSGFKESVSNGLADEIASLTFSLSQLFNTYRLASHEPNEADYMYKSGGIALSCWLLNALDVRANMPETASHAEKRLGLTLKIRVLKWSTFCFKLPLNPDAYLDVMQACHDVATLFKLGKGDAFAIVSEDFYKTDNYAGVVLLRWPAFYQAFGVTSLKEWYTMYDNIHRMEITARQRVGAQINPQFG